MAIWELTEKSMIVICFYLTFLFAVWQAVSTVQQKVIVIPEEKKRAFMHSFIKSMKPKDKVIIFVGKKLTYVITYQYHLCLGFFFLTEILNSFLVHIITIKCNTSSPQCAASSIIIFIYLFLQTDWQFVSFLISLMVVVVSLSFTLLKWDVWILWDTSMWCTVYFHTPLVHARPD